MRVIVPLLLACAVLGTGSPAAGGESERPNPRAPEQYPQPLHLSAGTAAVHVPKVNVNTVFESETFSEPELLPPEAWDSTLSESPETSIQVAQYPFEDSAARDEDPKGHYSEPRWNPFPFLSEQMAQRPVEHGLIWKEVSGVVTVVPGPDESFGMTSFDWRTVAYFGEFPIFQLAPRFSWHLLNGPAGLDLPSQIFDMGLDAILFLPLGERWSVLGMVAPNLFTDFSNTGADAFRMTGRIIGFYQWSPSVKALAGFLYLGRADIAALPTVGVIYQPNDDFKAEILFPKPKVSWRTQHLGDRETWWYLAGEFGGNSWAIQHSTGVNDLFTYRDYRLLLGREQVNGDRFRWLVEGGFAFGRVIEFRSLPGTFDQAATGIIRGGLVF